ncbi:MAG: hypothetical protein HOB18_09675 [Nitrospina sp.]|nr:hypothetical protein [Nitrospina sp.]
MKVDHVIPESLNSKPIDLASIKKKVAISDKFDILGYENLVPSCYGCNRDKSDLVLEEGALQIQLAKIEKKIPALIENIEQKRMERDLDKTLLCIARSVDAKKFTYEDLIKLLKFHKKFPNGISGASPAAPPMSPETRASGIRFHENEGIVWAGSALKDSLRLGLNADKINALIYETVLRSKNHYSIKKLNPTDILLRLDPNVRITFQEIEEKITILSIYRKK